MNRCTRSVLACLRAALLPSRLRRVPRAPSLHRPLGWQAAFKRDCLLPLAARLARLGGNWSNAVCTTHPPVGHKPFRLSEPFSGLAGPCYGGGAGAEWRGRAVAWDEGGGAESVVLILCVNANWGGWAKPRAVVRPWWRSRVASGPELVSKEGPSPCRCDTACHGRYVARQQAQTLVAVAEPWVWR